jgi:hypothetical protein
LERKAEGEVEVGLNRNRILIIVALVLFFGLLSVTSTASATVVAGSGADSQTQVTFTIVLRSDPTQGCITIAHTGPTCAYNGTTEVQWSAGDYEMAAFPNLGFRFVSWNASGGVFVPYPTTTPTTITVSGSGTLQANFSVITTTSSLQPQNLQPTVILGVALTLIIVATAIVLYRKRSQTPKPSDL